MGGARASVVELALDDAGARRRDSAGGAPLPGAAPFAGVRAWRGSVALRTLTGRLVLDDATGALVKADISATFAGKSDEHPIAGALEVHAVLSDIATTAAVQRPPT